MKGRVRRICTSFIDVPDNIAVAIYFAGCTLRCKGCQNKELWNVESGELMSDDQILQKIEKHPLADYVVFLGGEPTDQIDFLVQISKRVKEKLGMPVAIYTGREFEVLPKKLLENLELIVCGPYREDLAVDAWPASLNQRVFRKDGEQWKC